MLLVTVKRQGLPGGDVEAFAFLGRYEMRLYGQRRSVQLIKKLPEEKIEVHRQWMKAVENMSEDTLCHAHTNKKRMAHRAELKVIRDNALPANRR